LDPWKYLTRTYGANHYFFFGPTLHLRLNDASLIREVLTTHSYKFAKPSIVVNILRPLAGANSLLIAEGEQHKRLRRIAGTALQFDAVKSLLPAILEYAAWAVEDWLRIATLEPNGSLEVEFSALSSALTLGIISRAAFASGTPAETFGGRGVRIGRVLVRALQHLIREVHHLTLFIPGWSMLPLTANVQHASDVAEMHSLSRELVAERAAALKRVADPATVGTQLRDSGAVLLDQLIAGGMEGPELFDNALTLLVAGRSDFFCNACPICCTCTRHISAVGHETTAQAITFAMYLLGKYPDWQARARAEVISVCGDAPLSSEHVGSLHIISCIIYEASWFLLMRIG
jgi:cytochrome P450